MMKRFASLIVLLLLTAAPARAHWLWIVPGDPHAKAPTAQIVFNDTPTPGKPDLLKKIEKASVSTRDLDLKETALQPTTKDAALSLDGLKDGSQALGAVLKYGVYQKEDEAPALVYYYAKTYVGEDLTKPAPKNLLKPWDKLSLEIVPLVDRKNTVQVLWQGKPLANVEVVLYVPGEKDPVTTATKADGTCEIRKPSSNGVYALRTAYTEKTGGEFDNKKYEVTRHFATLTFPVDRFLQK